jgi:mRNA interferase MazF
LNRGDIVLVVMPGDYGKLRPALVVQSDEVSDADYDSVVICLMTTFASGGEHMRLEVFPTHDNGLNTRFEIMVEKIVGLSRQRIRRTIGRLDGATMRAVDRALVVLLGIGEQTA